LHITAFLDGDFPPESAAFSNQADKVGFGEGFRMPARGDLSARAEGRCPKASQEGTRGAEAEWRLWARLGDLRQVVRQGARCAGCGHYYRDDGLCCRVL
jgi:hypothetical protein